MIDTARQATAIVISFAFTLAEHGERMHRAIEVIDAAIDAVQAVVTLTSN